MCTTEPTSASVLFFAVSASFVTVTTQHAANFGLTFLIKCNLWKGGFCDRLRANWNRLSLKCSQAIILTWVIASSTGNVISLMYQYKWIWMNKGNICFTQRNKMVPAASAWLSKNREIQKGGKKSFKKTRCLGFMFIWKKENINVGAMGTCHEGWWHPTQFLLKH